MLWSFSRKKATRNRDIPWALEKIVSRRELKRLLGGCQPSDAIETVAAAMQLDTEKVLGHVASALNIAPLFGPAIPTTESIRLSGFPAKQLRNWKVAPHISEGSAQYALAIADPSLVSISEFQALGIQIFLSLGSRIEAAWESFFRIESAAPAAVNELLCEELPAKDETEQQEDNRFQSDELLPILAELALQCQSHGAVDVRMLNGSRCCYEFSAEGNLYSGSLHPEFLKALKRLLNPLELQAFRSPVPEVRTLYLESKDEHDFRLFWDEDAEQMPRSGRIVIIDDDERFAYLLSALLKNRSYEVVYCQSAKEALPRLLKRTLEPDVIICDVHMPGMDGGGFLASVRQAGLKIPTLILTSDDDALLEAEMVVLGASAFLQKREDPRILIAWIENLLERRQHEYTS